MSIPVDVSNPWAVTSAMTDAQVVWYRKLCAHELDQLMRNLTARYKLVVGGTGGRLQGRLISDAELWELADGRDEFLSDDQAAQLRQHWIACGDGRAHRVTDCIFAFWRETGFPAMGIHYLLSQWADHEVAEGKRGRLIELAIGGVDYHVAREVVGDDCSYLSWLEIQHSTQTDRRRVPRRFKLKDDESWALFQTWKRTGQCRVTDVDGLLELQRLSGHPLALIQREVTEWSKNVRA